ncbi:heptahelical transmembrane protein 1-like [Chenopodium quinoa]|uniref:heptahelical transmembrane protein 1-like n=1 Tax=Chenopodium quinoa TaxID=63459 RepID=UPI000B77D793|nr:heptahelical transmembrane protein 1-like [Chenopodium quinoa]
MCSARNRGKQGKTMENGNNFCENSKKCNEKYGQKSKNCRLLSFHELPDYMKDNEFIHKYYRAEWPLKQAFFSLFQWHNETLNVWTHLLGFILFVGLTVVNAAHVSQAVDLFGIFRTFPSGTDTNSSHDSTKLFMGVTNMVNLENIAHQGANHIVTEAVRWPFYVYLAGSMFCLLSSSVCHLFCCHSHDMNLWLLRMDYTGITVMIITSFFPPIYYIFQCQPLWQITYLAGISIFGAFTIATLLSPTLSSGKCRAFRAILFVSMGLFGLIPAVHACVLNWNNPRRNLTLAYESAMALSYLIGTGFYVSRVPERWRPGWFDLAGHSHQIFHVFVLLGALAHYGAALLFMEYRDAVGC